MEHHRYSQFYKGIEVCGGQIIQHYKHEKMIGINGGFYKISDLDTTPLISKDEAVEIFRLDLNKEGLKELGKDSKLIIYPVTDRDYHTAYHLVLEKGVGYSMTGIIDAVTGEMQVGPSAHPGDDCLFRPSPAFMDLVFGKDGGNGCSFG